MIESNQQANPHTRKVRVVTVFCGYAAIVLSVPWMLFFAVRGDWPVVVSDVFLILLGVVGIRMARRGQLRNAAILLVASLYVRLVAMTVFFDIPSEDIPRSMHHFFIPLALATYLMLKHESPWLKHGLAWASLATVVFFANSAWGIPTKVAVPDEVRLVGNWVNNFFAMGLLYLLLHIFARDIELLEASLHWLRGHWIKLVHRIIPGQLDAPVARFGNAITLTIPHPAGPIPVAATQNWQMAQMNRAQLMVLTSALLIMVLGLLFAVFFSLQSALPLVVLNLGLAALGLVLAFLAGNNARGAAMVSVVLGLLLIILVNAALLDIPTATLRRTVHYWYLPLALGSYFLLRHEPAWVQNGLALVSLAAFIALGSSNWAYVTQLALADHLRPLPWLVCGSALAALYLLVYVMVGDIRPLEQWLYRAVGRLLLQNTGSPGK